MQIDPPALRGCCTPRLLKIGSDLPTATLPTHLHGDRDDPSGLLRLALGVDGAAEALSAHAAEDLGNGAGGILDGRILERKSEMKTALEPEGQGGRGRDRETEILDGRILGEQTE